MASAPPSPDDASREDAPPHEAQVPAPSPALVETELERIAASTPFRRSARHVRFLNHLVHHTLAGHAAQLREMALGVEVFHRSAARFDPRADTIVRVEARRLREKLARYYADEGLDARLQFTLPVGSYRIEIRRRAGPTDSEPGRSSIAVHALVNDSGDATLDELVRGMSAEFVSALSRLNGLRVVADDSPPSDGPALRRRARELRVGGVVSGSVLPGPRLQLRLVDPEDGALLWMRQQALSRDQVPDTLEPLARGIITEIQRTAVERQLQRIRLAGSAPLVRGALSAEVREQMALARAGLRMSSLEACRKAVQLAGQACEAAPRHAPAYALLAEALIASVGLTAVPAQPTMAAARAAAQRAIELDPELADTHGAMGTVAFCYEHDPAAAEAHLLRALRFGPADARGHARYGWMLMMLGRFDEARSCYAEARELDPLSMLYRVHEGLVWLYARDYARAGQAWDAVLEVVPDHLVARALQAALHLYAGRVAQGLAAYQALSERFPKLSIGRCGLGQALALAGDRDGARRHLQWLIDTCEAGQASPYQAAMVLARLGDGDQALAWLERAADSRDLNFVCAGVDPAFDTLRGDPRLHALLVTHGLRRGTG